MLAQYWELIHTKAHFQFYLDKTSEDIIGDNSFRMEIGNKLKKFVAKEFTNATGKKVRAINKILVSEEYPFEIANIDRKIVGEKSFLLCKVTNSFSKKIGITVFQEIMKYNVNTIWL